MGKKERERKKCIQLEKWSKGRKEKRKGNEEEKKVTHDKVFVEFFPEHEWIQVRGKACEKKDERVRVKTEEES